MHGTDKGTLSFLVPDPKYGDILVVRCDACGESWVIDTRQLTPASGQATLAPAQIDVLGTAYPEFFAG